MTLSFSSAVVTNPCERKNNPRWLLDPFRFHVDRSFNDLPAKLFSDSVEKCYMNSFVLLLTLTCAFLSLGKHIFTTNVRPLLHFTSVLRFDVFLEGKVVSMKEKVLTVYYLLLSVGLPESQLHMNPVFRYGFIMCLFLSAISCSSHCTGRYNHPLWDKWEGTEES